MKAPAIRLLAIVLILTFAPSSLPAAAVAVTERSVFNGGDVLDWAGIGVPGTTTASNAFSLTSTGGVSISVSKPSSGGFIRLEQGPRMLQEPPGRWRGNFAPGDSVLYTDGTPGPVTMDFGIDVFGGGLQIQASNLGAFTATVQAFDSGGASLGTFSFSGNSFATNDNSAIFVGAVSETREIRKLVFNAPGGVNDAFAMNRLSFAVVPEPATGGLIALGIAWLGLFGGTDRRLASRRRTGPAAGLS